VPFVKCDPLEQQVWDLVVQHVSDHAATLDKLAATLGSEQGRCQDLTRRRDALAQERVGLERRRRACLLGETPEGASLSAGEQRELLDAVADQLDRVRERAADLDRQATAADQRGHRLARAEAHLLSPGPIASPG
jgi:hypothetical protein